MGAWSGGTCSEGACSGGTWSERVNAVELEWRNFQSGNL